MAHPVRGRVPQKRNASSSLRRSDRPSSQTGARPVTRIPRQRAMSPLSAPPCKQLSAESRGEREPKRGTFNVTRTVDQRKGHACVSEGLPGTQRISPPSARSLGLKKKPTREDRPYLRERTFQNLMAGGLGFEPRRPDPESQTNRLLLTAMASDRARRNPCHSSVSGRSGCGRQRRWGGSGSCSSTCQISRLSRRQPH